jgi:hypothetical protein
MQVQLQGGTGSFEGILEISTNTTWQPVCKDNMTMNVARILCQTLGSLWLNLNRQIVHD